MYLFIQHKQGEILEQSTWYVTYLRKITNNKWLMETKHWKVKLWMIEELNLPWQRQMDLKIRKMEEDKRYGIAITAQNY